MAEKSDLKGWVEAMKELPSIPNDIDRYRELYLAISPTVLQKDRIYDVITGYFDSDVLGKLISVPAKKEQFNMLAVGLGEGKHELHMLKKLSSHFASIRLVAVDPNKGMLQTFCEKLANCDVTETIECHPFSGTYAEFLDSSLAGDKFNLITAIHSLYYMKSLSQDLEIILSSLDDAGILYADIYTDENQVGKMYTLKPWLTERTPLNMYTSCEVESIAEKIGYVVIRHRVPIRFDCSSILDEASVYGNQILDYLTLTPNFRRDAPKYIVEDTLTFWRYSNLSNDQGVLTVCGDDDVMVISK